MEKNQTLSTAFTRGWQSYVYRFTGTGNEDAIDIAMLAYLIIISALNHSWQMKGCLEQGHLGIYIIYVETRSYGMFGARATTFPYSAAVALGN